MERRGAGEQVEHGEHPWLVVGGAGAVVTMASATAVLQRFGWVPFSREAVRGRGRCHPAPSPPDSEESEPMHRWEPCFGVGVGVCEAPALSWAPALAAGAHTGLGVGGGG